MKRRATIGVAVAVAVAVAAAIGLAGESKDEGTAGVAAGGAGGARVERRTLAERLTATGTIGYAGESTVVARLSGTVTWLPAAGDAIRRGERLYEIEGEPVLLMYGEVPAYRELAEGASGGDVEQLEENLAALGYQPGTVDEEFTGATAAAVASWQEDLGLEATGTVELGRVAFLPGARRVTEVGATLGEALGGGGGLTTAGRAADAEMALAAYAEPSIGPSNPAGGGAAAAPDEGSRAEPESPRQGRSAEPRRGSSAPTVPQTAAPSAAGGEGEASGGGGSELPSVPILETSSTRRVVTVELEPDQQSMARRGQEVEVILPDGSQARGEVRRLVASEEPAEEGMPGGGETEAGVQATIVLKGKERVPALDGATVSVLFTQRVREDVLAVPLTALLAVGEDRFAVVLEEGGARRRIEVTPGLAADGYVEVEGKGLRAGMRVEVAG